MLEFNSLAAAAAAAACLAWRREGEGILGPERICLASDGGEFLELNILSSVKPKLLRQLSGMRTCPGSKQKKVKHKIIRSRSKVTLKMGLILMIILTYFLESGTFE